MDALRTLQRVSTVVILIVLVSGCKHDTVLNDLTLLKEKAKAKGYGDEEQRIELAQEKWQNGKIDREPILISAHLAKATGDDEHVYLGLFTFDEDVDVVGFGLKEDQVDTKNLKASLTEEYPAFVHRMSPEVVTLRLCPVQIRNADQHKNVQQWSEYVKGEGIDVSKLQGLRRWRETLPPVWISLPDPNNTDVLVYIYDAGGHKSEPIKLVPFPLGGR